MKAMKGVALQNKPQEIEESYIKTKIQWLIITKIVLKIR